MKDLFLYGQHWQYELTSQAMVYENHRYSQGAKQLINVPTLETVLRYNFSTGIACYQYPAF